MVAKLVSELGSSQKYSHVVYCLYRRRQLSLKVGDQSSTIPTVVAPMVVSGHGPVCDNCMMFYDILGYVTRCAAAAT